MSKNLQRLSWIAGLLGTLSSAACQPPHYTVAMAQGPTHMTFAQRHHKDTDSDYLVDCMVTPDGQPANCSIVPLPARKKQ